METLVTNPMQSTSEWKIEAKKAKHYFDLTGIIFIAYDQNQKVILANKTGCEFLECTEKQIANKNLTDVIPFEQPKEAIHTPITYQQVLTGDNEPVEYLESQFLPKSGKRKMIAWQNVILRGKNRRIIGGFFFGKEVTAFKKMQQLLQGNEERYRSLVQRANDAIYTIDSKGIILSWNYRAEEIFGYAAHEVIHKPFLLLAPKKFTKIQQREFHQAISKEKLQNRIIEGVCVKKDGTEFQVEVSVSSWKSGNEHIFTVILRDITERKEADEKLLRNEKALQIKTQELEEVNIALRVLLNKREEDKKELEARTLLNIREKTLPYLEKLQTTNLDQKQKKLLAILESSLNDITATFSRRLLSKYSNLTPSEIRIAKLIEEGKRTKEIAELTNISPKTVEFHRNNMRRKLGIKNKKVGLNAYFLSIQ